MCYCRTSLLPLTCPVARRLLKTYSRTVRDYRAAQVPLQAGIVPGSREFQAAYQAAEAARQALWSARREFWRHKQAHGCQRATAGTNQEGMEERLHAEMLQARDVYDRACEKHRHLLQLAADAIDTPDGGMAFEQARRMRLRAYDVYSEALRRYTDFTTFGELPLETEAAPSGKVYPN